MREEGLDTLSKASNSDIDMMGQTIPCQFEVRWCGYCAKEREHKGLINIVPCICWELMESTMKNQNEKYESITVEVNTPDGTAYYTICEDNNTPIKIISTFGKAGTALAAWAFAVDTLVNMLLAQRTDINDIIAKLSKIGGSKPIRHVGTGIEVSSGPEGLVVALLEYKRQKFREIHLRSLMEGN